MLYLVTGNVKVVHKDTDGQTQSSDLCASKVKQLYVAHTNSTDNVVHTLNGLESSFS